MKESEEVEEAKGGRGLTSAVGPGGAGWGRSNQMVGSEGDGSDSLGKACQPRLILRHPPQPPPTLREGTVCRRGEGAPRGALILTVTHVQREQERHETP